MVSGYEVPIHPYPPCSSQFKTGGCHSVNPLKLSLIKFGGVHMQNRGELILGSTRAAKNGVKYSLTRFLYDLLQQQVPSADFTHAAQRPSPPEGRWKAKQTSPITARR